jgi:hypothetical protein
MWLMNKKIAVLRLLTDEQLASVYGRHGAKLNLDAPLLCCVGADTRAQGVREPRSSLRPRRPAG